MEIDWKDADIETPPVARLGINDWIDCITLWSDGEVRIKYWQGDRWQDSPSGGNRILFWDYLPKEKPDLFADKVEEDWKEVMRKQPDYVCKSCTSVYYSSTDILCKECTKYLKNIGVT